MISPYFFDEDGHTINNLTQWDNNQKLILEVSDEFQSIAPKIHFCNKNSKKALVVQSIISNNQIIADIPNSLLEEPYNITAYVFLIKQDSGKTIVTIDIPVRKRPKPDDYEYKENIHVIYLTDLIQTVEELNRNVTSAETIRTENETVRITNESTREANEIKRQQNFEQAIKDTNEATQKAVDAATEVMNLQVTEVVNQAVSKTEEATKNANQSATQAVNAANNANSVANQILADKEAGLFKGEKGDVQYATFNVRDGELYMYNTPEMTHTNFSLVDGNLIVEVNG